MERFVPMMRLDVNSNTRITAELVKIIVKVGEIFELQKTSSMRMLMMRKLLMKQKLTLQIGKTYVIKLVKKQNAKWTNMFASVIIAGIGLAVKRVFCFTYGKNILHPLTATCGVTRATLIQSRRSLRAMVSHMPIVASPVLGK